LTGMKKSKAILLKSGAFIIVLIFSVLSIRYFQIETLIEEVVSFWRNSTLFWGTSAAYLLAFLLRALAWKIYIPKKVKYTHCVQGVLLSLFINHITPIKAGDIVRAGLMAAKEKSLSLDESAHSVIVMRVLDVFTLVSITAMGLFMLGRNISFNVPEWIIAAALSLFIFAAVLLRKYMPLFFKKHFIMAKEAFTQKRSLFILPLVICSWILEGFVIWNVAESMGIQLTFLQSSWVNSLTVGGQVFQITPGGISTYESVMTAALTFIGIGVKEAYTASILSHGYKFVFSYITGLFLIFTSPVHIVRELGRIGLWRKKDYNEKRI
jgi:uncharacterized membrane protein YbhN (UPF0104 family)